VWSCERVGGVEVCEGESVWRYVRGRLVWTCVRGRLVWSCERVGGVEVCEGESVWRCVRGSQCGGVWGEGGMDHQSIASCVVYTVNTFLSQWRWW